MCYITFMPLEAMLGGSHLQTWFHFELQCKCLFLVCDVTKPMQNEYVHTCSHACVGIKEWKEDDSPSDSAEEVCQLGHFLFGLLGGVQTTSVFLHRLKQLTHINSRGLLTR